MKLAWQSSKAARIAAAALFLCTTSGLAMAVESDGKQRGKAALRVEEQPLDPRVAESRHVFIGEGVRVYFVDRQFREAPYIRAAGDGAHRSAMVVVKVVRMLKPAGMDHPQQVLVPITTTKDVFGDGRSPYDREIGRHVGKQGIWYGEILTRREYGDERNRKPLENPVTVLQRGPGDTRKAAPAPLPMARLKQVSEALASRKAPQGELAKSTPAH